MWRMRSCRCQPASAALRPPRPPRPADGDSTTLLYPSPSAAATAASRASRTSCSPSRSGCPRRAFRAGRAAATARRRSPRSSRRQRRSSPSACARRTSTRSSPRCWCARDAVGACDGASGALSGRCGRQAAMRERTTARPPDPLRRSLGATSAALPHRSAASPPTMRKPHDPPPAPAKHLSLYRSWSPPAAANPHAPLPADALPQRQYPVGDATVRQGASSTAAAAPRRR
jgi:hypothetical protein